MAVSAVAWAKGALVSGSTVVTLPGALAGAPVLSDVPAVAVAAYVYAAATAPCPVDYRDLAGMGWAESGHGTSGGNHVDDRGNSVGGEIVSWADAHGWFQFIPTTWAAYAKDGNGDGHADLYNVWDAAVSAAGYLCELGYADDRDEAIHRYNGGYDWRHRGSEPVDYLNKVNFYSAQLPALDVASDGGPLVPGGEVTISTREQVDYSLGAVIERQWQRWIVRPYLRITGKLSPDAQGRLDDVLFATGSIAAEFELPATPKGPTGTIVDAAGIEVDTSLAPNVIAMVDAAAADGITLAGSGWRSNETQRRLRMDNGCPDVDFSPASTCQVPTAIPGTSNHETGLAIDFDLGDPLVFDWLAGNAARFGFHNLPSEPWHWSVDGR